MGFLEIWVKALPRINNKNAPTIAILSVIVMIHNIPN